MEILDEEWKELPKESVQLRYRWVLYLLYYFFSAGSLYLGDWIKEGRIEPYWSIFGDIGIGMLIMVGGLIYLSVVLLPKRWWAWLRTILFFPIFAAGIFGTLQIETFRGTLRQDEFALEMFFNVAIIIILIELLRFLEKSWIFGKKKSEKKEPFDF